MKTPAELLELGIAVGKTYLDRFLYHPLYVPLEPGWEIKTAFFGTDRNLFRELRSVPYAYLARRLADDSLHCFFRGTASILYGVKDPIEWEEDADFAHVQAPFLPGGALMHAGFLQIYNSIADARGTPIGEILAAEGKPVAMHGHSLGGALATVAAVACGQKAVVHTLWAAPRVFAPFAVNVIAESGFLFVRIVNHGDPVPTLPFPAFGYAHVAAELVEIAAGGREHFHALDSYLEGVRKLVPCAP